MKKEPVIRLGQRVPYRKGNHQEIDERVNYVKKQINAGKTKTQIHLKVMKKFNVQWRQCDRYMASARLRARVWTLITINKRQLSL